MAYCREGRECNMDGTDVTDWKNLARGFESERDIEQKQLIKALQEVQALRDAVYMLAGALTKAQAEGRRQGQLRINELETFIRRVAGAGAGDMSFSLDDEDIVTILGREACELLESPNASPAQAERKVALHVEKRWCPFCEQSLSRRGHFLVCEVEAEVERKELE
jgi:hypothetical protein